MPKRLFHFAEEGKTEEIVRLIQEGINIHSKNENGDNALLIAAHRGHVDTVRLLLDSGAYLHSTNNSGFTPLITAAMQCHTEVVRVILEYSKKTSNRTTPSAVAVMAAKSLDYREGCGEVANMLRSNPG